VTVKDVFRYRLKLYRKQSHLSQRELSSRIGKGKTYVHLLEAGHRPPTFEILIKLSEALKVPVLALLSAEPGGLSPEVSDTLQARADLQELALVASRLNNEKFAQLIGFARMLDS
jgi:transcriptional regulator with XRE-family HTH domain